MAKQTIVIVEDEDGIAEALQYQLQRDGFAVARAADGRAGLDLVTSSDPALVILDLMLPGMAGEDVCREIRKTSDVPIVMLTAKDDEVDKVLGLELGADDYVTKPFSSRELLARIHAILRRPRYSEKEGLLSGGGITLDRGSMQVTVEGQEVALTPREFELLEYLMERPNKVVRREAILEEVWGFDFGGDSRTLDVHIKRLRAKCERDRSHPEHLLTVRGVGYRFVP